MADHTTRLDAARDAVAEIELALAEAIRQHAELRASTVGPIEDALRDGRAELDAAQLDHDMAVYARLGTTDVARAAAFQKAKQECVEAHYAAWNSHAAPRQRIAAVWSAWCDNFQVAERSIGGTRADRSVVQREEMQAQWFGKIVAMTEQLRALAAMPIDAKMRLAEQDRISLMNGLTLSLS